MPHKTSSQLSASGSRRKHQQASFLDSVAFSKSLLAPVNPFLEKLFSLDKLRDLYRAVQAPDGTNIFNRILKKMNVVCSVNEADFGRVPKSGATVVVANHPFGILDGILLGALLLRVRPDLKTLTNYLLTGVPELDEYCVALDPFMTGSDSGTSSGVNQRGLRGAMDWLRQGGMLLIFPAGEVAHLQWMKGIADPVWSRTAYRLARTTHASVLPIFIDGRNSVPFQLVGLVHPRLRTARLPKEFLRKHGAKIEVRIGKAERIGEKEEDTRNRKAENQAQGSRGSLDEDGTEWLRWKTYVLANRAQQARESASSESQKPMKAPQIPFFPAAKLPPIPFLPAPEPIAEAVCADILETEIAQLVPSACLERNEEYAVYCAQSAEIPQILREIGRLREVTFRQEGEGTGKSVDLDRFDQHYRHLFLWNKTNREIVGAYRLAETTKVLSKFGVRGLYTSTLFRFKAGFFDQLGPAVELGRSFVRCEYQRQYAPLLLLWKAIGRFVALNPENPVLFGAVSISNSYAPASRMLMYQFFQTQFAAHPLSALVQPWHPFRSGRIKHCDIRAFQRFVRDPEELSGSVSEFELDGKGIPILLKQYLKVGGQVLAFNVDGRFSDVLDGLIVVDLRSTDRKNLHRYLGNEGAERFLRHHQATVSSD